MEQPPQIPPAVIQFAEENNYDHVVKNIWWSDIQHYKHYKTVYCAYNDKNDNLTFILINDNEMRFSNSDETYELLEEQGAL